MSKQDVTQVQISGLATNSNPNALPAGSCAVAENVVSRRPGTLTPVPSSTALATITSANYTTGKGLWSDADNSVVAVLPLKTDSNSWTPGTSETQTGELVCYSANQTTNATSLWELTQLNTYYSGGAVSRSLGFLPGLTQAAYSHFRTIITEKWGNVVSTGSERRWAGLPPPKIFATATALTNGTSWFVDGNSCLYRAYYSIESTNTAKPYSVIGPVSTVVAAFATSTEECQVQADITGEGPVAAASGYTVYLNIFRSTQDAVESAQDLPYDFRRVIKKALTLSDLGVITLDDNVTDAARAAGEALYTNPDQNGEQGNAFCPPTARDIAVFRDTTFYANRAALPALTLTVPGQMMFGTAGLLSDEDRTAGIGYRSFTGAMTTSSANFTIASASERIGIVIGQEILFTGGITKTITNVVGSTVTMNSVWAGSSGNVVGVAHDMAKVKVYYADGTTFGPTSGANVITLDLQGNGMPGLRTYSPVSIGYPLPAEGGDLTFIFTYPAIKRVKYFEMVFTNGQNYSPAYTGSYTSFTSPLTSTVDTRPNRLFFSKTGQPEEVPLINYVDIGAGTILKMWATGAALLILCTDGLWRLTGTSAPWQVDQVDPTVQLLHPDCVGSLNNQIFAWVEDGLALVDESGAKTISTDAVGQDIRDWSTQINSWGAPYFWGPCIMGDHFWNEIWLNVYRAYSTTSGPDHITTLVYNTDSKNFTRLQAPQFSSLQYSSDANRMISQVFIQGSPNNSIALTVQSDFYDAAGDGWQPATVWFNALQTGDKGKLKQWMDVSYFVANVDTTVGTDTSYMKALFDARNTSIDPLEVDYEVNVQNMVELNRDIHFWVPRRAALSDQLQLGLKTLVIDEDGVADDETGFNFQLQGFTVRYRIASDTLKR